jgi:hypothetical protein
MEMDVGGIHFSSKCNQIRQSNYTLIKILCEFIDNVITKCTNINIVTEVNNNYIYKIIISDDCVNGFENIFNTKQNNPLNMGYVRSGHDDDNEISEFGIGMKAAAIACANKFEIYTKTNDKYYKIEMDFVEMSKKISVNDSYNPTYFNEITKNEYRRFHKFNENGTTLVLSEIRKQICKWTENDDTLNKEIANELTKIYGLFKKI